MRYTRYRKLGDINIQFFTGELNCLVHVVYTEVFSNQTQKVFGTTSNNDLTSLLIHKPYGVSNHITPCTSGCAEQNGVILSFFNIVNGQCLSLIYQVSVLVKVSIIERYKLKKNMFI